MDEALHAAREMPRYQCHKKVWALKIAAIVVANPPTIDELEKLLNSNDDVPVDINPDGSLSVAGRQVEEVVGAMITPAEEGYMAFPVSREFMLKHKPQIGGYYVVYDDGYKSFSPATAFDEGYTLIA